MYAFPPEKKTSCPGRSDTRALRGTPFDRPDILSHESHSGGSEATRRRRFPGRATARPAMLAVALLLLLTLLACGSEDSQEDRRTRPPRDTATPAPTEDVDGSRTAGVTAEPDRPVTGEPEQHTPSPVATREATPVATSRAPTERATPTHTPATQTEQAGPTEPVPTSTPAAQTVDICDRQESVRAAILGTLGLDMDACDQVTGVQLRQITRLDVISVQELIGYEFHGLGLDNLESLSLEAHTLNLPIMPLRSGGPILQNLKLLQITAVPVEQENANNLFRPSFRGYNYSTGLEQVEITFVAGDPGESTYIAFPWGTIRDVSGIRLHIKDYRPYSQRILSSERFRQGHLPELIIEFGPTDTDYVGLSNAAAEAGESTRNFNFGMMAGHGENPWLKDTRIDRLTIINHDTDFEIAVDTNFIENDTPAAMYVELRGFKRIHRDAFDKVRGPLTLHLDPDPEGNPHRLHFSEAVETPTGSGFLPLPSRNTPFPETPDCNHGLTDLAERIYQSGWDTEQWILEASQFIESNPEDCHTNSYVPVAEVPANEMSCSNERRTIVRSDGSFGEELYLQWERDWLHRDQPHCWMRGEGSDGSVYWSGRDSSNRSVEIALPEGSPYRWK